MARPTENKQKDMNTEKYFIKHKPNPHPTPKIQNKRQKGKYVLRKLQYLKFLKILLSKQAQNIISRINISINSQK